MLSFELSELRSSYQPQRGCIVATSGPVRQKSYEFALAAIRLQRELVAAREYEIARQFVRSATSVGANIEEALAGQSRRDFAARMTVASKEARESLYWLRLIRDASLAPAQSVSPMIESATELVRLLTAIVKSTRQSLEPGQPR